MLVRAALVKSVPTPSVGKTSLGKSPQHLMLVRAAPVSHSQHLILVRAAPVSHSQHLMLVRAAPVSHSQHLILVRAAPVKSVPTPQVGKSSPG